MIKGEFCMAKKKFNSHLYFAEKMVWRDHQRWYIKPEDGTLYSGCYPTKIKPEDLPDWYVFGRYYKRWGYMSTKGIADLLYRPSKFSNHFLKDDCLYISYKDKISENPDVTDWEHYIGWDERVWGSEIIDILKGARQFSNYDIASFIEQLKEKVEWLKKEYPEEFLVRNWHYDVEKDFAVPLKRLEKQPTVMADICQQWETEIKEK